MKIGRLVHYLKRNLTLLTKQFELFDTPECQFGRIFYVDMGWFFVTESFIMSLV